MMSSKEIPDSPIFTIDRGLLIYQSQIYQIRYITRIAKESEKVGEKNRLPPGIALIFLALTGFLFIVTGDFKVIVFGALLFIIISSFKKEVKHYQLKIDTNSGNTILITSQNQDEIDRAFDELSNAMKNFE